jgi:hypothetical protein
LRTKPKVLSRAIIIKSDRAVSIDGDNDIGTTLDEFLKVL